MKVSEYEIRPEEIFNEYLALTKQDIITFFKDVERTEILCPACNNKGHTWVKKGGFSYKLCPDCLTIYVSPRPNREAFDAYYTDSESTKFWATTFYKITEAARREKLWKPKAKMIKDLIYNFQGKNGIKNIVDIGGGYGIFDEEMEAIMDVNATIIEPSLHLAEICRKKGFRVIEKFMEDILPDELPQGRKCFVSFELFEHLYDPPKFLNTVNQVMDKNDLFIFTTLSGMGVDIQVLGENAKSLSPPHHLNFFNPKSVTLLLTKLGFKVLEASTPGKLDIDILYNNKTGIKDSFWKNVLDYYSEEELNQLQQVIANAGLSSHMMITCKKI